MTLSPTVKKVAIRVATFLVGVGLAIVVAHGYVTGNIYTGSFGTPALFCLLVCWAVTKWSEVAANEIARAEGREYEFDMDLPSVSVFTLYAASSTAGRLIFVPSPEVEHITFVLASVFIFALVFVTNRFAVRMIIRAQRPEAQFYFWWTYGLDSASPASPQAKTC